MKAEAEAAAPGAVQSGAKPGNTWERTAAACARPGGSAGRWRGSDQQEGNRITRAARCTEIEREGPRGSKRDKQMATGAASCCGSEDGNRCDCPVRYV